MLMRWLIRLINELVITIYVPPNLSATYDIKHWAGWLIAMQIYAACGFER